MKRTRISLFAATALVATGSLGLMAGTASAATFVEDFESYATGTVLHNVGGWTSDDPTSSNGTVVADPINAGNQVGYFVRTDNATAGRSLDLGGNAIADGTTDEFSIDFLFDGSPNSAFGLSTLSNPDLTPTGAGTQLSVLFRIDRGDLQYMTDQSHSISVPVATNLSVNTWYTVSGTINNTTDMVSNIKFEGSPSLTAPGSYTFNLGATAAPLHGDLKSFAVYEQGFVQGIYLDNIAVPEPASLALIGLGGLAFLPRRRRKQIEA